LFKEKINTIDITSQAPKFDPIVNSLLQETTVKRDKKRFILGLIFGALILGFILLLFTHHLLILIINFVAAIKAITTPLDTVIIFGRFSLNLELLLIIGFIPSSFLAGYVAGSRKKGKWIGIVFFFVALGLSSLSILLNQIGALYVFMLIIYIPLVMVTSVALGYLGGLLRDRSKLYPIPPELQ